MSFTLPSDFHDSYKTVFKTFASGKTKSLQWRKWQLKQTWWMLQDNHDAIVKALKKDLNRHPFESTMTDIKALSDDTLLSIQNLEKWTADEIPDAGFVFGTLGKARIRKEPLGVSLIIGAWNFPVSIVLQPMVAAITAGCCMILKPSELAPAVQQLLVEIIPRYLDNEAIRVVTGGPLEMGHILSHKFNHIFYTGSSKVAKIIAVAAAKHLTPVTLELGGQGPAVVSKSADVDLSAKRIASSKVLNAGQICLSVNHVFCAPEVHDEFVQRLGYWFDEFLGEDKMNPEHMVRIVNERNFDRLEGILSRTDGTIVYGGPTNRDDKYIHPTIVTGVQPTDALMSEELFGPILPVIKADLSEAVATINSMEHPLGLYVFSQDDPSTETIISNTISGGVTVNDVLLHAACPDAPFGGVGDSGTGSFHGKYGVLAFSHLRTVVALPTYLERFMGFRYPPYDMKNLGKAGLVSKVKFRRGEGMEDQRIKKGGGWWSWMALGLGIATVGIAIVVQSRYG